MKTKQGRYEENADRPAFNIIWDMDETAWEELRQEMGKDPDDRIYAIYGSVSVGGVLAEIETDTYNELSDVRLYVKGFDDGRSNDPEDPYALDDCYISMDIMRYNTFDEYKKAVEGQIYEHRYYDGEGVLIPGYTNDWNEILSGKNGTWM